MTSKRRLSALAVLLLFISLSAQAQPGTLMGILPTQDGSVYYKQTVEVAGLPKAEVFRRARRWWILNYKSAKDVLQLSDEHTGELIGKGYNEVQAPAEKKNDMKITFLLHSTMTLDAADNSYTITVSQVKVLNSWFAYPGVSVETYKRSPEKNLIRVLQGVDQQVKQTYASMQKFIQTEQL